MRHSSAGIRKVRSWTGYSFLVFLRTLLALFLAVICDQDYSFVLFVQSTVSIEEFVVQKDFAQSVTICRRKLSSPITFGSCTDIVRNGNRNKNGNRIGKGKKQNHTQKPKQKKKKKKSEWKKKLTEIHRKLQICNCRVGPDVFFLIFQTLQEILFKFFVDFFDCFHLQL